MIFLECKGGQIQYKPEKFEHYKQGKWQTNKPGPLEDAKFGKKPARFIKKELKLHGSDSWVDNIPAAHGAIFPNTPRPEGNTT